MRKINLQKQRNCWEQLRFEFFWSYKKKYQWHMCWKFLDELEDQIKVKQHFVFEYKNIIMEQIREELR